MSMMVTFCVLCDNGVSAIEADSVFVDDFQILGNGCRLAVVQAAQARLNLRQRQRERDPTVIK